MFVFLTRECTEIELSPLNGTHSAPGSHFRLSVGDVWITGQLDIVIIRSARHGGIKMCQAQIKIMVIILLQELQSSVRPGPRYGPVGCRRLKSGLFNRYVIVGISEVFGHNHADLQSVTPALAHDPSVNYSTAPRPKRCRFKFEKNSSETTEPP